MEEFERMRKVVDPSILQVILLDELCGRLEEQSEKLGAFITFMGPMTRMFKAEWRYQYKTVPAGRSDTVFKLENPQPDLLMGIITQVANDWYPNTYLDWLIDYSPKRVEYKIAEIENPKGYERGIPFEREVRWIAYNNDVSDHVFGVLCDGFFISKKLYQKIVSI